MMHEGGWAVVRKKYTYTDAGRRARVEANRRRSRPVICLTDGRTFPSATEAAGDMGVSISSITRSIRRGGSCVGLRFAYVDATVPDRGEVVNIGTGAGIWV